MSPKIICSSANPQACEYYIIWISEDALSQNEVKVDEGVLKPGMSGVLIREYLETETEGRKPCDNGEHYGLLAKQNSPFQA